LKHKQKGSTKIFIFLKPTPEMPEQAQ